MHVNKHLNVFCKKLLVKRPIGIGLGLPITEDPGVQYLYELGSAVILCNFNFFTLRKILIRFYEYN
jgi:hypothetical protein